MGFWERFCLSCKNVGKKPNPVGKEIGVSSATVSQWKNGSIPNGETLLKIADYFGISTDYLLGRTNNNSNRNEMFISARDINGDNVGNNWTVNSKSELENEISNILSKLNPREKTELMMIIYNFYDEHKNNKEKAE